MSAIEVAIYNASSSADLATKLEPIVSGASNLPPEQREAVSIAATVAQSSYDYWGNQYAAFRDEIGNEYGPCISSYAMAGYSPDYALSACMSTELIPAVQNQPEYPPALFAFASHSTNRFCGVDPSDDLKAIAAADAHGAWSGFFAGIFFGDPVAGALVGAAGSSIARGAPLAARQWWCIMR